MYKKIKKLFEFESSGGILLVATSAIAILIANSPLTHIYQNILHMDVALAFGPLSINKDFVHFVNDGLMAAFFLLVGLEIKREILEGELSSKQQLTVPLIGAAGGVLVPALIYTFFNFGSETIDGWAIPAATDIAFALGILSLFGKKVPISLKVFLTALAIIDDLAAIIIIAVFYTSDLSTIALIIALIAIIILVLFNIFNINRQGAYVIVGTLLWVCVLKSGVHATLAGVILGLTIPLKVKDEEGYSLLRHMEHNLSPWVSFVILPIFAFANAGVILSGMSFSAFLEPITLGIVMGLFIGKQAGVFLSIYILIKLGLAKLPEGSSWLQFYGVSVLTGVGFTMSLFIGNLAFTGNNYLVEEAKLGVITGSVLSSIIGYLVIRYSISKNRHTSNPSTYHVR